MYILWGTTGAEVKVLSVENTELSKLFPLMPCTGQNIATDASPTTKNFFVSNVSFPGSFKLFSKSVLHIFFLHYLWLIQVPVLAQRERTGSITSHLHEPFMQFSMLRAHRI